MKTQMIAAKYSLAIASILICFSTQVAYTGPGKQSKSSKPEKSRQNTIIAVTAEHGKLSPSGNVPVYQGGRITFSTRPDSGYQVDSVIVDEVNQGKLTNYTFTNVTANHIIRATFSNIQRSAMTPSMKSDSSIGQHGSTISAQAGAHGRVTPAGINHVDKGGVLEFSIKADPGYAVDSVIVDEMNVGKVTTYTFTNVEYDHTLRVTFVKEK